MAQICLLQVVELGGMAESGTVGLNVDSNNLVLSFPVGVRRANVSLTNGTEVDVTAGDSGSIAINAQNLDVLESFLYAGIESGLGSIASQAGDITLNATGEITVGQSSRIENDVNRNATGNGGDINITTGELSVTNRADLSASTFGQGNAGSVTILARDTVSFDGEYVYSDGEDPFPSGAFSSVEKEAVGNGGGINITTGALSVTNGAQLQVSTCGQGNAGSMTILARDTVSFNGVDSDGFSSGAFSSVVLGAVGSGGGINITTGALSVTNGAGLSASSRENGLAGDIEVKARSIRLDNQAFINSDTIGGQGNIILRSEDLVLRRGSNITTNATGTATGGNITIDTGVIAALENSDISANAEEASGGQVRINAQGIFGTEFRNQPTSGSDITASSALGLQFSGNVQINTSNVDLNQGLITLPVELVNVEGLIANSCIARSGEQGGSFNITGAGGLPTRPGDAAISPYPTGTVRSIPNNDASLSSSQTSSVPSTDEARRWKMGDPIVEPQGVYRLANGELVLSRECSH